MQEYLDFPFVLYLIRSPETLRSVRVGPVAPLQQDLRHWRDREDKDSRQTCEERRKTLSGVGRAEVVRVPA
jgi:hypothetical protein